MEIWSSVLLPLVNPLKRVWQWLSHFQHSLALLFKRQLFDRQVTPTLDGQGVRGVKDRLYLLYPN